MADAAAVVFKNERRFVFVIACIPFGGCNVSKEGPRDVAEKDDDTGSCCGILKLGHDRLETPV
jgi:hypothetical protein